jgi:hypothetical protein
VTAAVVAAAFLTKSRLVIIVGPFVARWARRYPTNASHGNTEPQNHGESSLPKELLVFRCFRDSVQGF